ncbi:unnamed protein product [Meloidogyne enterolobii]|uniref:Uncharacterized protein n=1 Tax=Meloidogyne enterolobii TaxID=390850 RepID=A0ACB0Z583_MELEN
MRTIFADFSNSGYFTCGHSICGLSFLRVFFRSGPQVKCLYADFYIYGRFLRTFFLFLRTFFYLRTFFADFFLFFADIIICGHSLFLRIFLLAGVFCGHFTANFKFT